MAPIQTDTDLKYEKLLLLPEEYIIIGIKPGRKLPPKRD